MALLSPCVGCALLKSATQPQYETVSGNPNYDTKLAEAEHGKALKLIKKDDKKCKPAKLEEAETHLQKALLADVTYGPAHNTLGIVYFRQHKLYMAAWEFEYAAKVMPDRFEPPYNLGQVYEAAGKMDMALSYYDEALALAPNEPSVIGSTAAAQLKQGRTVDEIRPLLEKLVFHDNRPDWVQWAQDELGRFPIPVSESKAASADQPPKSMPVPKLESSGSELQKALPPSSEPLLTPQYQDSNPEMSPLPPPLDKPLLQEEQTGKASVSLDSEP